MNFACIFPYRFTIVLVKYKHTTHPLSLMAQSTNTHNIYSHYISSSHAYLIKRSLCELFILKLEALNEEDPVHRLAHRAENTSHSHILLVHACHMRS